MKSYLLSLMEIILFSLFFYVCYYSIEYFSFDKRKLSYFQRVINTKYLTIINLYILTLYFGLSIFAVFLHNKCIQSVRSSVLSVTMALGWFVTLTFWGLYFYNRELVYPKSVDKLIPKWWNYAAHLFNVVAITSEAIINKPKTRTTKLSLYLILILIIGYVTLIEYHIRMKNFYVYPIFKMLPELYRYLFNAGLIVAFVGIHYVSDYFVNRLVAGATQKLKSAKSNPAIPRSNQSASGSTNRRKIRKD